MGIIAETFGEMDKVAQEHLRDHPDCAVLASENVPLDNEQRAKMLYLVNEGRKLGVLNYEDEIDLEMAIGTDGDPENFGWPATTTPSQKIVVVGVAKALEMALDDRGHGHSLDLLAHGLMKKLGIDHGDETVIDGALVAIPRPDKADLPPEITALLADAAKEAGVEWAEPEAREEAVDWLRHGYL